MGFDLMLNFNMPYFSQNLADFWRRWHISLSTWFKEYLYIPLGGNRVGRGRLVFNLMAVFVVSGLWHGAATNFVVWGAMHGAGLVALLFAGPFLARWTQWIPRRVWAVVGVVATFHYVVFSFAIWQTATSLAWLDVMGQIVCDFGFAVGDLGLLGKLAGFVAVPLWVQWQMKRHEDPERPLRWPLWGRGIFYAVCLFCMLRFGVFDGAQFIYFQF
jgi:D-alanyl-lipoteichoic acid acyltransferase DltB (MBOAT superfamily)